MSELMAHTPAIYCPRCGEGFRVYNPGGDEMATRLAALEAEVREARAERARYGNAVTSRLGTLEAALKPFAARSCTSDLHTGGACADSTLPRAQWCDTCVARAALEKVVP